MEIDLKERIPGCRNFFWKEVFATSHDKAKNFKEFLALPNDEKEIIIMNVIGIANRLQVARDHFNTAIRIGSWWRSPRVEAAVGGSGTNHYWGDAVDPQVTLAQQLQLEKFFASHSGGLGLGKGQMHIDLGYGRTQIGKPARSRWRY